MVDKRKAIGAALDAASIGTAAIPIFGGSVAAALQAIENHRLDAEIGMIHEILDALTHRVNDVETSSVTMEQFIDLADHATRAAPDLRSDELRVGVANIVVLAFVARPPQIARAHLLIEIASNLSPEALAVLRAVSRVLADSYRATDRNTARPWPKETLAEAVPTLEGLIDPLIGQLESVGSIHEIPARTEHTKAGWTLTSFGVQLLNHLDGMSAEDPG